MPLNELVIGNFKSGLVTSIPDDMIPDDAFSEVQNIVLDDKYIATPIYGVQKYNTTKIADAHIQGSTIYSMKDGTKYYVVACGGKLYYSIAGSRTWTAYQVSEGVDMTFSSTVEVEFAQYNNKLYMVNSLYPCISNTVATYGTVRMIQISGTTVLCLRCTDIPKGLRYIIIHQERMFGANGTDAYNGIWWTNAYFDYTADSGTNWTPIYGVNYDYVGKDDGEIVYGIKRFNDYVFVFKPTNVYRYSTNGDITSWGSVRLDTKYGTYNNRTICEFDGKLVYLSNDGIAMCDGVNVSTVDGNIKNEILALPQLRLYEKQYYATLPADFQAGTYGADITDARYDELSIRLHETATDWNTGTKTQVTNSGNSIVLSQELYTYTDGSPSQSFLISGWHYNGNDKTAFQAVNPNNGLVIDILTIEMTFVGNTSVSFYGTNNYYGSWTNLGSSYHYGNDGTPTHTYYIAPCYYRWIYVDVGASTAPLTYVINSVSTIHTNTAYRYLTSGTFETQTLDYGFVPAILGKFCADYTTGNSTTLTFQIATADTDDFTSPTWVDVTAGSDITATPRRYVRIKATFGTELVGNGTTSYTPTLNSFGIGAIWQSPVQDTTVASPIYGNFEAHDIKNSQTISYYIRTSADNNTFTDWTAITSGSPINITQSRYFQLEVRLSSSSATSLPVVEDIKVNYSAGGTVSRPCAIVFRDNYLLNVASVGNTTNDTMYTLHKSGYILKRTDMKFSSLATDSEILLGGDSLENGFVWYLESGDLIDTTAIDAYFVTKRYRLSAGVNLYKQLYLTYKCGSATATPAFTISYSIDDGDYVDMSIPLSEYLTTINRMFGGVVSGSFIKFKIRLTPICRTFEFHEMRVLWEMLWSKLPI